jgi:hypothetical protein
MPFIVKKSDARVKKKKKIVSSGVRTHASRRRPELESGALDHSAMLTTYDGEGRIGLFSKLESKVLTMRDQKVIGRH